MTAFRIPWRAGRILALGGDLKCRPALAEGEEVRFLDEVGDLASPEAQDALDKMMFGLEPDTLVCDKHPGYYSSTIARDLARSRGLQIIEVSHHRAHVAAVCLELEIPDAPVVGLAFDGTGYGDDGTAWGGEFFVGSVASGFVRRASFAPLPLPGGDAAVREPWRIAAALLIERGTSDDELRTWLDRRAIHADLPLFRRGLASGIAIGRSSALGRWFDAVSALLGLGTVAGFEAEPAIRLQQAAEAAGGAGDAMFAAEVRPGAPMLIDFPDLARLAQCPADDVPARAFAFHQAAAEAVAETAAFLAKESGCRTVIASGGCFLNRLFDRLLAEALAARGLEYRKPILLPPGDQALALGQAGLALAGRAG